MNYHPLCKSLTAAHYALKEILTAGDTVIDATMGNGHDTLFLAEHIGSTGTLHAFDVQQQALEKTAERLHIHQLLTPNIHLHLDTHAHLNQYVTTPVKAVVFNLGYLPGSDKSIITKTEDTLSALEQSCQLLEIGGLLSVLCYPGHSGGSDESLAVTRFFKNLPHSSYLVTQLTPINVAEHIKPPFLFLAQKTK